MDNHIYFDEIMHFVIFGSVGFFRSTNVTL